MKSFIILIFLLGSVFALYQYGLPAWDEVKTAHTKLAEVKDLQQQTDAIEDARKEVLARLNSISDEDMKRLDTLFPTKLSQEDLYVFFSSVVPQYGMHLEKVVVTDKDTGTEFTLKATGSYANVRSLFDGIENNLRLMDIKSITIGRDEKTGIYTLELGGAMYHG